MKIKWRHRQHCEWSRQQHVLLYIIKWQLIRFQALWKTKSFVKMCLKFKLPLWTKCLLIHLSPLWQLPLWHFPRWHNFPVYPSRTMWVPPPPPYSTTRMKKSADNINLCFLGQITHKSCSYKIKNTRDCSLFPHPQGFFFIRFPSSFFLNLSVQAGSFFFLDTINYHTWIGSDCPYIVSWVLFCSESFVHLVHMHFLSGRNQSWNKSRIATFCDKILKKRCKIPLQIVCSTTVMINNKNIRLVRIITYDFSSKYNSILHELAGGSLKNLKFESSLGVINFSICIIFFWRIT